MENTRCVVVGGGPAGVVLGLLLARAGIDVTVLEKHGDFLRDFRGDTVHASTLELLDELGLWERLEGLPWKPMRQMHMAFDTGEVTIADFGLLRTRHPYIAMIPQWHLLNLLVGAASEGTNFHLIRHAEVRELIVTGRRVSGVRWIDRSDSTQDERELAADLVVACDGRDSVVRAASGLPMRHYDVSIDSWWLRLPHHAGDREVGGSIRRGGRGALIMLDRGDFYQMNLLIPRGADQQLRSQPLTALHELLTALHPWLADRVTEISSWDQVKLLRVRLNRLRRWSRPGLLCIGDAAHAMSPAGGIGINLAVQDAVAAARYLARPLSATSPDPSAIDRAARRVQRRRMLPTVVTQGVQRLMHRQDREQEGRIGATTVTSVPPPLRLIGRLPVLERCLQRLFARFLAIGVLPESAPAWARRDAKSSVSP